MTTALPAPSMPDAGTPCPCGSGVDLGACCGRILAGAAPETAETLMRSRFTAFFVGRTDHLLASWHPDTRPGSLELEETTLWRRLQIVDTTGGGPDDTTGIVEFRASFLESGNAGLLHERSRFSRVGGLWMYVDGDQL